MLQKVWTKNYYILQIHELDSFREGQVRPSNDSCSRILWQCRTITLLDTAKERIQFFEYHKCVPWYAQWRCFVECCIRDKKQISAMSELISKDFCLSFIFGFYIKFYLCARFLRLFVAKTYCFARRCHSGTSIWNLVMIANVYKS